MWLFYLVAAVLVSIGAILWHRSKHISGKEFLFGGILAFATSALFHLLAYLSQGVDTETWSGKILEVVHQPTWVERYTYVETYTTGSGKNQRTHTRLRTAYRTHPATWTVFDSIPNSFCITEETFDAYVSKFRQHGAKKEYRRGSRGGMVSGDANDYFCVCPGSLIEPTIDYRYFENRVRSGPTAFGFEKIDPKDETLPPYPNNGTHLVSDRLVDEARFHISVRDWDILNAKLGPAKYVNLILVGFGNQPSTQAHRLRSKWFGGKKNDLVLCYGWQDGKVTWSEVFGWTKSELCKSNLRTILLEGPIDATILPKIEHEVRANYTIRDWSEFDYISIEPPLWCYILFFLVTIGGQVAYYFVAHRERLFE